MSWVQLSRMFLKLFDFTGIYVTFNFDDSVLFLDREQFPPFFKAMLKCFNKAFVFDRSVFANTIYKSTIMGK